jgi:cellulose synthase/poly-beta-1,6-N-acetylglucosamine synthase-like glycosyltransferase
MTSCEIAFWVCLAAVVYPYALYPLLLAVLAYLRPRPVRKDPAAQPLVSFVVCACNEEHAIDRRIDELADLIAASGLEGEVIVVSDGSTDGTAALARAHTKHTVRVLELPERVGKAAALTRGVALARNDVVVFADVRQTWDAEALRRLVANFADPEVGGVSGDLLVRSAAGTLEGVALYWRYEKMLRRLESRVWSVVGATGAISAVRRELFRPIPAGTLLDDVYWPLQVVLQGYRVVHDSMALAYDRLPERARDEFRRKVRTLAGNFQLVARLPAALVPGLNPIAWQYLSHKVLRLAVPWALLALVPLSAVLPGVFYRAVLGAQLAGYGLGLLGLWPGMARASRLASVAASFLVLNGAAWVSFWVWLTGRAGRSWRPVAYHTGGTTR